MDARRLAIALLVIAGLALAGCTIASQDSEYPDEAAVEEKLASLETIEADVITERGSGDNASTIRTHTTQDLTTGQYRSEIRSGPNEGVTLVMDGEQFWYYQPRQHVVQAIDDTSAGGNVSATADTVGTIYERLNDDGDGDGEVGISPAPTVPAASEPAGANEITLPMGDDVSVSSAGTDTVDGRETRVVGLEVEDDRSYIRNATYYIDTEWHVPLKTRIAVSIGDRTIERTITYTNVSINEPIDPGRFEFDPPATATVVEGPNAGFQQFESYEGLAASVDRAVPDPSLPDGYEFDAAEVSPAQDGQSITMVYADRSNSLAITKHVDVESELSEDGETVRIAGQSGRRTAVGPNVAVSWTCGGNTYSVVGPQDGPSLIDVAESIGCE